MNDFLKAFVLTLVLLSVFAFLVLYIADGFKPPCSCECQPEPRPPVKKMT
jgi:hypothetical protein